MSVCIVSFANGTWTLAEPNMQRQLTSIYDFLVPGWPFILFTQALGINIMSCLVQSIHLLKAPCVQPNHLPGNSCAWQFIRWAIHLMGKSFDWQSMGGLRLPKSPASLGGFATQNPPAQRRGNRSSVGHDACAMAIVHACAMAIVHACAMAIVQNVILP